jgi:hypothetical protein
MTNSIKHKCVDRRELLERTVLNIKKFGLQVIMVSSNGYNPSFAYSIGLNQTYDHPEIICFGLPNDLGHAILNDVNEIIRQQGPIKAGKEYDSIFKDGRATFLEVDDRNIEDYFGVAIEYYKEKKVKALQLIWTDRNDKFPWEENFEETFAYSQPLLDRNVNFKYREPKNLAVFTTRQWLDLRKPILRVVHEEDGDWQFLTGDQEPEDIKVVALEQLVLRDKTLNEVFDLNYGEAADRDSINGQWTRSTAGNDGTVE